MPRRSWQGSGSEWSLSVNRDQQEIVVRHEGTIVAHIPVIEVGRSLYADASTVVHVLPSHVHDQLKVMDNVKVPSY